MAVAAYKINTCGETNAMSTIIAEFASLATNDCKPVSTKGGGTEGGGTGKRVKTEWPSGFGCEKPLCQNQGGNFSFEV